MVFIVQRSSEQTVARAKLEHHAHAKVLSAADRKKPYVQGAEEQIVVLSKDEDEIDPTTGKAYHVLPKLMSPYMEKRLCGLADSL